MTDEELIARLQDGKLTWGDRWAAAERMKELLADREKDHANINLKADFIDKTLNQLAETEAKLAAAVELLEKAAVLAKRDLSTTLCEDILDFTTEIKGE